MGQIVVRAGLIATFALLPLLFLQGQQVRRRTPRLPGAHTDHEGAVAAYGAELRLLVIGESTAAGVGVGSHRDGLAGQVACALSERVARTVSWQAVGRIGATARTVRRELLDEVRATQADFIVIALGVNDTLAFTWPARWRTYLRELIDALRARVGAATVMISPVPPLGSFQTLPQPLRAILGLRARALDRASHRVAREMNDVHHVAIPFAGEEPMMCSDRFHPSAEGYRVWGLHMADAIAQLLAHRATDSFARLPPHRGDVLE
nr:hypothetical protein [uncultured bacterium]